MRTARERALRARKVKLTYAVPGASVAAAILLTSILIFGMTSRADEKGMQEYKYYTSVLVTGTNTLEEAAQRYADPSHYRNTTDYYREVCEINHLTLSGGDVPKVAPGNYVIVPYYSADLL